MKRWISALSLLACFGCAGNPSGTAAGSTMTDAALYSLVPADPSWKFYKHSATPIMRASVPHAETHALVRYNLRAATQLDPAGKVRDGAVFPDSSIIVKELSTNGTLRTYAVMMKVRGSPSADANGWIWAELGPSGAVKYSTSSRGNACTACHSVGIDYTRMNDSHP